MKLYLNTSRVDDYRLFLQVKQLPQYRFHGHVAEFPDEYAERLGLAEKKKTALPYYPIPDLFDYQRDIAALAIRKQKFACFMECGTGKTLVMLEFARHAMKALPRNKRVLIVSPLMVIKQTLQESERFYKKSLPMRQVAAHELNGWLRGEIGSPGWIGITNYEAIRPELKQVLLGALILDESSLLKSAYGKWGTKLIELGKGLDWKLALTGTPAPNDRIEYANHAVFLDTFPTVNSFLARYFINRGQTQNRWELKPHALEAFYRDLSHWCIFLSNPATYGWKDNTENIPPIIVHIHDLELTGEQQEAVFEQTGRLFLDSPGGITTRSKLAQIGKGNHNGRKITTLKPQFIRDLVDSWPDESTIIWCWYNKEQEEMEKVFPEAVSLHGQTPHEERERGIEEFKSRKRRILISKSKVLGWGLNLQVCTRMVFSGLNDSWESYYQCVKRANRIGSTLPLNVHIPISEVERPMVDTVIRKAHRVQIDTEWQENTFKRYGYAR